jgi:hypothetical protein
VAARAAVEVARVAVTSNKHPEAAGRAEGRQAEAAAGRRHSQDRRDRVAAAGHTQEGLQAVVAADRLAGLRAAAAVHCPTTRAPADGP